MRSPCILIVISVFIYISIAELSQRTAVEKDSSNVLLERNIRASGKNVNQKKEKKNKPNGKKNKSKAKKIKNYKNKKSKTENKNSRKKINMDHKKKAKVSKNKNKRKNKKKNHFKKTNISKIRKYIKTNNPKNKNKNNPKKKTKEISKHGKKAGNKRNKNKNRTKKKTIKVVKMENKPEDKTENKKKFFISESKRNKVKDNGQNNLEKNLDARQSSSEFEATMWSMARKYKLYQAQFRKADRIESWVKLTSSKKTKAATTFSKASTAIQESTDDGTRCGSRTINDEAMTANSRLKACSTTAAALCDSSAEVNSSSTTLLSTCKSLLKIFNKGYEVCLTEFSSACSCMGALTPLPDDSSCTSFKALENAMKERRDKCIRTSNEGSFGDCRNQERQTAYYGWFCKPCSCPVTTVAPAGRKKYLRDLIQNMYIK